MSSDAGKTWSKSTIVITRQAQLETFAGKWFPHLLDGAGAMILITDGGPGGTLTPFISNGTADFSGAGSVGAVPGARAGGSMVNFVPTLPAIMEAHPPVKGGDGNPGANATKGDWQLQMDFIPNGKGEVVGVSYSLFSGEKVWCSRYKTMCGTYSHTTYPLISIV
jgi:hypothetical protein